MTTFDVFLPTITSINDNIISIVLDINIIELEKLYKNSDMIEQLITTLLGVELTEGDFYIPIQVFLHLQYCFEFRHGL